MQKPFLFIFLPSASTVNGIKGSKKCLLYGFHTFQWRWNLTQGCGGSPFHLAPPRPTCSHPQPPFPTVPPTAALSFLPPHRSNPTLLSILSPTILLNGARVKLSMVVPSASNKALLWRRNKKTKLLQRFFKCLQVLAKSKQKLRCHPDSITALNSMVISGSLKVTKWCYYWLGLAIHPLRELWV